MSQIKVQRGDSPLMVARRLGTSVASLMAANPHKPTTVVAGKQTWHGLGYGETLNVPFGIGMVGAVTPSAPNAPHAEIRQGSTGPDVALWQTIIGVTADGDFGPQTAAATRAWQGSHGVSVDGVVGPQTWAAALGGLAPAPAPSPVVTPSAFSSVALAAGAAILALNADPNYCKSVASTGTAVNTAVHNFKAAWNAANPGSAVPIGTGNYEPSVAAALSSALGGVAVPPGCGAGAAPVQPPPFNIPSPPIQPPPPVPNPPTPPFNNPPPPPPPYQPPPAPPVQPVTPVQPAQPTQPVQPAQPGGGGAITPPAPTTGLSTGAMVAGGLGLVALVGLVAIVATGSSKKSTSSSHTTTRGPARKKPAKKHKKKK